MLGREWQPIATAPIDVEIQTLLCDEHGPRNMQSLVGKKRTPESRILWFFPDMSMYVYYEPTHWRAV